MLNQGPIVRYTASVCEIFFSDFRKKTFSAESPILTILAVWPGIEAAKGNFREHRVRHNNHYNLSSGMLLSVALEY